MSDPRPEFHIRAALLADLDDLVAFNLALARESEGKALDSERLRRGVARLLNDASRGFYTLAVDPQGQAVGCTLITFEYSDWRHGDFWWIQSVYVRPDWRGRGVFSGLFAHLEGLARSRSDVVGLRLYVDRHNHSARAVYEHLGLRPAQYDMLERDFVLG
jgi:GNAT superfamily N-acetyltransferase